MPQNALFLDRDGVINVDHDYVHRIEDFEFVPGIFDLTRFATHELGWPIVVVTNQSGIGRGYFDEAAFQALTAWMLERFSAAGTPLARVYHCPYHPEHGVGAYRQDHPWRKPKPGMILQAAADLDLDLGRSVMIGDRPPDMEAGAAAGVGLLVRLDRQSAPDADIGDAHLVVGSLGEAVGLLRGRLVRPGIAMR